MCKASKGGSKGGRERGERVGGRGWPFPFPRFLVLTYGKTGGPLTAERILTMIVRSLKYMLAAVTAISLLSSCAGSSTPTTPPGFQQNQSHPGKRATSPCPCLYVADIGQLVGNGLCGGRNGRCDPDPDHQRFPHWIGRSNRCRRGRQRRHLRREPWITTQ